MGDLVFCVCFLFCFVFLFFFWGGVRMDVNVNEVIVKSFCENTKKKGVGL